MDLKAFKDYLTARVEEETEKNYVQRLKFVYHSVESFDAASINSWLLEQKRAGIQANSLNNLVKAVRAYCRAVNLPWGDSVDYLVENTEPEKGIFSDQEIEAFLALQGPAYYRSTDTEAWHRWTVFFAILAFSLMRAHEVAKLTIDMVDFGTNNFIVPTKSKTGFRRVPIAANIRPLLEKYVSESKWYLFPSDRGDRGHIWRTAWRDHFNIRKKILDIKRKKLTTHSFRHSGATNLLEEGVSLFDLQQIMGHKNINSTAQYIHLTNKSAQVAINQNRLVKKSISDDDMFQSHIDDAKKCGMLDGRFEYLIEDDFFAIWKKGKKRNKLEFTDT